MRRSAFRHPSPSERRLAPLLLAGCFACTPASPPLVSVEDGRLVMGTVLELSLRVPAGSEHEGQRALRIAFETAARLDALASRFDSASALNRLNAAAGRRPIRIDADLYEMLALSESARLRTRGAFDATVGPLVALWSDAAARDKAPDAQRIAAARAFVGRPMRLEVDHRAALAVPGMKLDLGALAKGFALDRIASGLAGQGITNSLLSFGQSSIRASGQTWRLAIQMDDGAFAGVVELSDQALSMSSSLSQSSLIEGVRYGHVVDPRSGRAVRERRSALVVADNATDAEVLSTALVVLDEEAGRAVVSEWGAEARVISERGQAWQTEGWQAATNFEPEREPRR